MNQVAEIRAMIEAEIPLWAHLRQKLWPDCADAENDADIAAYLSGGPVRIVFLAHFAADAVGFAEISERNVVDGCEGGPAAYLEGWFVEDTQRGRGIGKALINAAANWARQNGYGYFGSDVELENTVSQAAHEALGFEETGRGINYRMKLQP